MEPNETDLLPEEETQHIESPDAAFASEEPTASPQMRAGITALAAAETESNHPFSDIKEYPEDPFSYTASRQEQVQLSNGTFQHDVTDFRLPGKDGFDLVMTRRYDSNSANLTDMRPYISAGRLFTGSRINNHNTRIYGLGYGWSFVLPSVEAMPVMTAKNEYGISGTEYCFVLHLEDGRTLRINNKFSHFLNYRRSDIQISHETVAQTLEHSCNTVTATKTYQIQVTYKNGQKDYFHRTDWDYSKSSENSLIANKPIYTLVARKDRFGNTIFFTFGKYGGMTIVDTWGQSITLTKPTITPNSMPPTYNMVWSLPKQKEGEGNATITYQIVPESVTDYTSEGKHSTTVAPKQLTSVTDLGGRTTSYTYLNPDTWKCNMTVADKKYAYAPSDIESSERKYMLLSIITHPTTAQTHFTYAYPPKASSNQNQGLKIVFGSGGFVGHFPLETRKEVIKTGNTEVEYHLEKYGYTLSESHRYLKTATVTKRDSAVLETHTFNDEGLRDLLVIEVNQVKRKQFVYTYYNDTKSDKYGLLESTSETIYENGNPQNILEKTTNWTYDEKGNVTKQTETYLKNPSCDQCTETSYDSIYNLITKITQKKEDQTTITQIHTLDKSSRVVTQTQIKENDQVKETIVYTYDSTRLSCVTEKLHYQGTQVLVKKETFAYTGTYTDAPTTQATSLFRKADESSNDLLTETFTYDNWGRLLTKTNSLKQKTSLSYDKLGRITAETLPAVGDQVYQTLTDYQDQNNTVLQTAANGQRTRLIYTPLGQLEQVILAASTTPSNADVLLQTYHYNTWGELIRVHTYDGTGSTDAAIKKTETATYDAFGRLKTRSIPQVNYQEEYDYCEAALDQTSNQRYLKETVTISGDSQAPTQVTVRYQDQKGQLRHIDQGGVRIATYEYDRAGNQIKQTDALGRVTLFKYDYAGRLLQSSRTIHSETLTTKTSYDGLGNPQSSWDEEGNQTSFLYDGAGRLLQTTAPLDDNRNQVTKYDYDGAGNLIRERIARTSDWSDTRHTYDARNRLIQTDQYETGNQWIRTCYQYDVMGQVTQLRTGDTALGAGTRITRYTYDLQGHLLTVTDAQGKTERYEYDRVGVLKTKTDRSGNRLTYSYDALDRLTKETVTAPTSDGTVLSEREYGYSRSGQKIWERSRQTLSGESRTELTSTYRYDSHGRLIEQTDPQQTQKQYQYDRCGNRKLFTLTRAGQSSPEISLFYNYDEGNRLIQVRRGSDSGTILAAYTYDKRSCRTQVSHPQSGMKTSYGYNKAKQIVTLEQQAAGRVLANWQYQYDLNGTLLSKTDLAATPSLTLRYTYDRLGRLSREEHSDWKRVTYSYDVYSNRTGMQVEGIGQDEVPALTTYEYDVNNRLQKEVKKQGKRIETHQYRYDENGNETFRIWEETSPTPDYPGDARLSGGFRYQTPTVYEWRQYNGFGQLIRVLQDEGETAYQYRGDGMRHSRETKRLTETAATMTVYLWDGSHIVGEQRTGKPVQFYLRGHNLIARQHDGVLDYYLLNEHGDVTHLRDQSGSRIASYRYDAFGQEKEPWEEDENPFRYCGEYFDTETNTVYLRNRDYRSSTGRFTQEDTHWNPDNMIYGDNLSENNPMPNKNSIRQSSNLYVYCMNNPLLFIDPSGFKTVVFYYNNPGSGFEDQAMNSPYYNSNNSDVEMIDVLQVNDFITAWNNLDDTDIDDVYLYLHGGKGVLYFKGESIGMTGDNSMESLNSKTVRGQVYLFSCKGGKGEEGNNVAWKFAKLTNAQVRATPSSVSFTNVLGKYHARVGGEDALSFTKGAFYDYYYGERHGLWGDVVAKKKIKDGHKWSIGAPPFAFD